MERNNGETELVRNNEETKLWDRLERNKGETELGWVGENNGETKLGWIGKK